MSKAKQAFEGSIKDAEELLAHFDSQPKPPPENAEVLKRAALVMALTAWETYIEDFLRETVGNRLRVVDGSYVGKFVLGRLEVELKRLNSPTSEKTRRLFVDFLEVDPTERWVWQHFDQTRVKKALDDLIVKRGDAVHRARRNQPGTPPQAHLIKREELDRAIRFLKSLVEATDRALLSE